MSPSEWANFDQDQACEYILRTSLARSFNAGKDDLLDKLLESMKGCFELNKILDVLRAANRSTDFNAKKIWAISYKDKAQAYFALSKVVDGVSLNQNSGTHLDHVIPKALLKGREVKDVNQLANLTILSESENMSKGKKQIREWLDDMTPEQFAVFCSRHAIPSDDRLYAPENFDEFISERKKLICSKTRLGKHLQSDVSEQEDDGDDVTGVDD